MTNTERIIRGHFFDTEDDREYFRVYERYRRLFFTVQRENGRRKRFFEFRLAKANFSREEARRYFEVTRFGRIPLFEPQVSRGYWLLRWLQILQVVFRDSTVPVGDHESLVVGEAYEFFCGEKEYERAAVVLRLSRECKVPFRRSVVLARHDAYIETLTTKVA